MFHSNKLIPISEAIEYIKSSIEDKKVILAPIKEAPLWLRLLMRGDYCVHKNVIYVPDFHYSLVISKSDADRVLSTAKLLPWFITIKDNKCSSFLKTLYRILSVKEQVFYFTYEYMFLRVTKHELFNEICIGFMVSRKTWYLKQIPFNKIKDMLQTILN